MAKIVNLKNARKGKARGHAEERAAENRAQHGRTKAEKTLSKAQGEHARRQLDAHKRDDEPA